MFDREGLIDINRVLDEVFVLRKSLAEPMTTWSCNTELHHYGTVS